MSSQPPNGQSVPPGDRTAAWKMDQAQPKRQVQKRPKRPRIDIDEQIAEANRLAAMLKKVQQSARNIKKSGQRTKKRLLAKAGRLSGDDLERISVIKRCGLIVDPRGADHGAGEAEIRPSFQISSDTTRRTITDQLVRIFDGIVTTGRVADVAQPAACGALAEGLPQSSAPAPTNDGVLRLASKARIGSSSICEEKALGEQAMVVVDGMDVDHGVGHQEVDVPEEDIMSVAFESPERLDP
jgi:hypothetical protein